MADAYDFWAARISSEHVAAIDDFWLRFNEVAGRIERHFRGYAPKVNPDAEIATALGPLGDDLVCDFEVGAMGQLTLVVTAELRHSRRALARAAVWRAPERRGWRYSDVRAPVEELPEILEAIRLRSRSDGLSVEGIEPKRGAHRTIDLEATGAGELDFVSDQAGIVLGALLGEDVDQDWLGEVSSTGRSPMDRARRLLGRRAEDPGPWLLAFRDKAAAMMEEIRAELPTQPYGASRMRVDDTSSFRLRPASGDRSRRRDALLYQSRDAKLVAARLAGARICGCRFSRFGEVFCGLKIRRGSKRLAEAADIATLGGVIEDALMASKAGGVIGRATGLEHAYIDLALTDLERAPAILRTVLEAEEVTTPTWLIFDDAGLEDFYHPLMPQTPDTPMEQP